MRKVSLKQTKNILCVTANKTEIEKKKTPIEQQRAVHENDNNKT